MPHRYLQVLATKMFKVRRGSSPEILRETFVSKTSSYNLRKIPNKVTYNFQMSPIQKQFKNRRKSDIVTIQRV